ncbi:MAG: hypothetical protein IH991_03385, partial [Planctomycetes bacterium]|nr:hypothetical protein [Planctomycetota bacterium]
MFHIINKQKHFSVLLLLIAAAALSPAAADDSDTRFERFLSRLGLTDLHIVHMEERVHGAADDTARVSLARRLADLYTQRLLTSGDEKEKFDDILRRVNSLIRQVPQANTPGLQVMLLQADFSRAESLINKWLDDRQNFTALDEARKILGRIGPELKRHFDQLSKRVDTLLDELGAVEDDKLRESKQQELDRLDPVVNQAAFFTGWSNYFLGVSRQDNVVGKAEFTTARTAFRRILGIADEEPYKEVNAEWLILSNDKRAQALIGLGLTEVALGNLTGSRICFQLLDHVS